MASVVIEGESSFGVATVGAPIRAVVTGAPSPIERYFWFSLIARGTTPRALAGQGGTYTPTKKLRGRCISVTVHFADGSECTSKA